MMNKFDIQINKRLSDASYSQELAKSVFKKRRKNFVKKSMFTMVLGFLTVISLIYTTKTIEHNNFVKAVQKKYDNICYMNNQRIDLYDGEMQFSVYLYEYAPNSYDAFTIYE